MVDEREKFLPRAPALGGQVFIEQVHQELGRGARVQCGLRALFLDGAPGGRQ